MFVAFSPYPVQLYTSVYGLVLLRIQTQEPVLINPDMNIEVLQKTSVSAVYFHLTTVRTWGHTIPEEKNTLYFVLKFAGGFAYS
jgi:hypothetical protein